MAIISYNTFLVLWSIHSPGSARQTCYRYSICFIIKFAGSPYFTKMAHLQIMKLEIKEIDGVPVIGSPGRSRTDSESNFEWD